MNDSLFRPPLTFLHLPYSHDFDNAELAILGLPFDCGIDPSRFGARLGPNAIRLASALTSQLLADATPSPMSRNIIDAGDVNLSLKNIHHAFERIEAAMHRVLGGNCRPVTLGGDGAISLPQMRAIRKFHPDVAVLHFDAHTDAWPLNSNDHFDNTTQFTHGAHENLIDVVNSIHVGTRGPVNAEVAIKYARDLGYEVIPFELMRQWGEDKLTAHLHERLDGRPVYLCFDMDFFDPSVAPGVATPTPGGASAADGIALLRRLKGLDVIAADINTTTPTHDPSGVTAGLAAAVTTECLALFP